jgi:alpha-L-arabinofuranosidase
VNVASTAAAKTEKIGLVNSGYWGIDVRVQNYTGSFYVRGAYNGTFVASLQSALGSKEVFGSVEIPSKSVANAWTQHTFTLVPTKAAGNSNNTFAITFNAGVRCLFSFCLGRGWEVGWDCCVGCVSYVMHDWT